MSNTDDLEEYDAELELNLKREYTDVFSIFRFCVITEEATYLCNELEMDCVPNASYLLFELDMIDVWVWDRNRPKRIIPRAHVFTTGDVTVEQLKEGDDGADLADTLPIGVLDQLRTQLEAESGTEPSQGDTDAAPQDGGDGDGDTSET